MAVRFLPATFALLVLSACTASGQQSSRDSASRQQKGAGIASSVPNILATTKGKSRVRLQQPHTPLSGANELEVAVGARILQANASAHHEGELTLTVVSELDSPHKHDGFPVQPPRLLIELPLASAGDAYGESRRCNVSKEGGLTFVFTAGLDEKNFVDFIAARDAREFRFSLNKYLCRALAAPFTCKSGFSSPTVQSLPAEMRRWKVGGISLIELQSKGVPARAAVSGVTLTSSGKPFDYATCATVAPSSGLCCVAHKTTEWHCGVTPTGEGWHQVSGDCFHRETGGTCSE